MVSKCIITGESLFLKKAYKTKAYIVIDDKEVCRAAWHPQNDNWISHKGYITLILKDELNEINA